MASRRSPLLAVSILWLATAGAAELAGTLTDTAGRPVAGAKLWAVVSTLRQGPGPAVTGRTDAEGHFALRLPREDLGASLAALADGYALAWVVHSEPTPDLQLVLEREYPLRAVVRDAAGKPVEGVKVTLASLSRNPGFDPRRTSSFGETLSVPPELSELLAEVSNAAGEIRLSHLPAGVGLSLSISDPRYARLQCHADWEELMAGRPFELSLQPPGTIRGRVVRAADAKPLAGVRVAATPGGVATTDANGCYRLEGLGPGTYLVYLRELPLTSTAAAVAGVAVTAGATVENVDLSVVPGVEVHGTVTEEDTGKPVPGVAVCCNTAQQPQPGAAWPLLYTGDDGKYSLRAPEGAAYIRTLSQHPDKRLEFTARGAPYEVNLRVPRRETVAVRVTDLQGKPLPYARVLQFDLDDYWGWEFTTDALGCAEAPRATGRRYVLSASHGESMTLSATLLTPQMVGPVALKPAAGARPTLTGVVVSATGQPIAHAVVRVDGRGSVGADVHNTWSTVTTALSGEDGRFRVRSVWPNTPLTLRVRAAGAAEQQRELGFLAPGETKDLGEVVLPVADLVISGTVLDPEGQPVAGAVLEAMRADGGFLSRSLRARSGPDGTFRLEGLPREDLLLRPDVFTQDGPAVRCGPDRREIVVRVIPRDKQVLYTRRFDPPLVAVRPGFRVTLTALHRYRGFAADGEALVCLGLDLTADPVPQQWLGKTVTAVDNQGRTLQAVQARYRIEGTNPGRGIQLPPAGATELSKILLDGQVLFEHVPLSKELTSAE